MVRLGAGDGKSIHKASERGSHNYRPFCDDPLHEIPNVDEEVEAGSAPLPFVRLLCCCRVATFQRIASRDRTTSFVSFEML